MSAGCSRGRIKLRFPGFANFPTLSHFEKKASVLMTGSFFFDMDFCLYSPIAYSALKKPPPPPQKGAATAKKSYYFQMKMRQDAPRIFRSG
jgi:hypothetical protein